ncbi:MAG: F0F1 ATP synthase subunit B [Ectothiorhodospiraceae bacterium]|nr:F0F1 ATP synthase subunit B [Ectothiorhodospiraceae bacterium]
MSINATLLAQMVVFAILVWFTMKYVWPLLKQAMDERETRIADGLAAAEKGKHDLELAEKRAADVIREGKDKAQELLNQANQRANQVIEEAKTAARGEADKVLASARAQIDQERIEARERLRKEVSALAVAGAEQILRREVDARAHAEALDRLASQL